MRVLVCAAVASTALPVSASAKPGYYVFPEGFSLEATLPKNNGYRISLNSFGHRWVDVALSRRGEVAHYYARGKANRHGVDVSFGRFGSVHARFTGHSVKREPPQAPCRARRPIELRGRLEGSIRFRGEGGNVAVASQRVRASYEHRFREVCDVGVHPPRKAKIVDVLSARGKSVGRTIRFSAFYLETIGVPVVSASTVERVGRVNVWKLSISENEKSRLEFSPPTGRPQTVTVKPTFPFSGSASYAVQPDGSVDWSGDLRVSFAGLGEVALTGPGFQAEACHIRPPHGVIKCENQEGSP